MKRIRRLFLLPLLLPFAAVPGAAENPEDWPRLYNPYERVKNGPPLTGVFHKVRPAWLWIKLREPRHHASARMPDFELAEEEALDVMAYLKSIAGPEPEPATAWAPWAGKGFEELQDDELDAVFDLADRGKIVWSQARCSICHKISGPGEQLIGGFVDLRVGGIDLQIAGGKLRRDWLYEWLEDPMGYFPETFMPRFGLSHDDRVALVEYILRDDAFALLTEEEPEGLQRWSTSDDDARIPRGRGVVETARCILCHDIEGIAELLPRPEPAPTPPLGGFERLAHDRRCLTCHSIDGRGGTYAPDLSAAGSRLEKDWIREFVAAPDMIRPLSQQMPKLGLTGQEAGIVADYMSEQPRDPEIPDALPGGPASPDDVHQGREAFLTMGCVACHNVGEGPGGSVGPDLSHVAERLRPGFIWHHLKHPRAENPYSPEPDYAMTDEQARALTAYLSTKHR